MSRTFAENTSLRNLRRLARDTHGATAVLVALSFTVMAGAAGIAVDIGAWQTARSRMQAAADQAAFAAATTSKNGQGKSVAVTAAQGIAAQMGFVGDATNCTLNSATKVKICINNPPASGSYAADNTAWEVIVTQPQPMWFANIFLSSAPTAAARAVARESASSTPSNACLIALDPGNPPDVTGIVGAGQGGLNVSGGGTMALSKCDIFVNAANARSIDITGGGTLQADNITTVGGVSGNAVANQKLTTGSSLTADPYATTRSIPEWTNQTCDTTTNPSGLVTMPPSGIKVYCSSITIQSNVSFEPGVYVIRNGSMTASGATLSVSNNAGSGIGGVTFVLTSNNPSSDVGVFDFKAGATLNLRAPSSGTTAGIALWADKNLPHKADNFRAGSVTNIIGAVYLPSHMVNFSGSAQATSTCFQLVADEIAISGGANFTHLNCTGVPILSPTTNSGNPKLAE